MLFREFDEDLFKQQMRDEGRMEGRAECLAEGAFAKARSVAKNLANMGMSSGDISKATGLSEEEVLAMEKSQA